MLAGIAAALRPDGTFLMVDIGASSHVHENLELPGGAVHLHVLVMHCMTVSLAHGGEGLGPVWGGQTARQMLDRGRLWPGRGQRIETDPFNSYYVATR